MRYVSTRGGSEVSSFSEAMLSGLAPDGGLFVPETTPTLPAGWRDWDYREAVSGSLSLFGGDDVEELVASAADRFDHPEVAPTVEVGDRLVMELFHGPTLSFKDHALQVLGRLLAREVDGGTVLGATSGDTGSAAMEACRGRSGMRVVILFPDGKVSEFQRRQMTTLADENLFAVAVGGTFDDCQAMVKKAFSDHPGLLAINSINWARIAAQAGYYIYAGARIGGEFDVAVPTGNFGNVYSCWTAKQMGVPIRQIIIANNANHALADLVQRGVMVPARVVPTSAPAMDIQVPSNLERFTGDPTVEFRAGWSTDSEIAETIAEVYHRHGYLLDPHTATAWRAAGDMGGSVPLLVMATAHPAKFGEAVEVAIGSRPAPPDGFERIYGLEERIIRITNDPSELEVLIR